MTRTQSCLKLLRSFEMDLLTDIRKIARPRDPIVAKQVENILERGEIYPPECDDLEAIDDAIRDYLSKP